MTTNRDRTADYYRVRKELEAWLRAEQNSLNIADLNDPTDRVLGVVAQSNIKNIRRILGDHR